MELLEEVDIARVGSLTRRNTLKLLAPGKSKRQKIVVGDSKGVVSTLKCVRGDTKLMSASLPTAREISAIDIGPYREGRDNKIIISYGKVFHVISMDGVFLHNYKTNLTEDILKFVAQPNSALYTAGNYIATFIEAEVEKFFYISNEVIHDIGLTRMTGNPTADMVLGCQDRVVRLIQRGDPVVDLAVNGPVSAIATFGDTDPHPLHAQARGRPPREIIYGTANGLVGQLHASSSEGGQVLRRGWWLNNSKNLGSVQCVTASDLSGDGVNDLVVTRDDGTLEVFSGSASQGQLDADSLRCVFTRNVDECITNTAAGRVLTAQFDEVVVGSYSGRVVSFSTEASRTNASGGGSFQRQQNSAPAAKRFKALQADIVKLQAKLSKAKEQSEAMSSDLLSDFKQIHLRDKFELNADDASYTLSIEADSPIDLVAIRSDVDGLAVIGTDSKDAILSTTPPDVENGNTFLCTLRCQKPLHKLNIKIRMLERRLGQLQAYVVPVAANRTARLVTHAVKPLCLHQRLNALDRAAATLNELRFTGSFGPAEAHAWTHLCLPDVPTRSQEEAVTLTYRSTFTGTVLVCIYSRGALTYRSDSVTTLQILKETVSREATTNMTRIASTFDIREASLGQVLDLVHAKVTYQAGLQTKVELVAALKEIQLQENGDMSWMSDDYKDILVNATSIEEQHKRKDRELEMLFSVVCELYTDKWRFEGRNMNNRVPALRRLLSTQYDLAKVKQFFAES